MTNGNLGSHIDEITRAYNALRAQGQDLFRYDAGESEYVIPLPVNGERRELNSEGIVIIDLGDIEIFKARGYSKRFIDNVSKGNIRIEPYTKIGALHHFSLGTLERALQGEITKVYSLDLDQH